MAKRELEFSLLAKFRDMASSALRSFARRTQSTLRGMTRMAGLGGGFAGIGGFRFAQMVGRPGGLGGFLSNLTQGATALAMAPVRILAGFARLIPGVGGIMSGVVGSAANILQGLVGIAANVVGSIINVFAGLVQAIAKIFERIVAAVGRILGKLAKIAAGIGLGVGALFAWQFFKGIRENMTLADWRQVLQKVYGDAAKAAEQYARKLSLVTPFTPMQVIEAVAQLGAARLDYERFMRSVVDWAAAAKRPLEEVVRVFALIRAGTFGEALESARRMMISREDLRAMGIEFSKAGQAMVKPAELLAALMAVIEKRFGGMAEKAAEVGTGPWSTFVGAVQNLRIQLTDPWYDRFNTALKDLNKWLLAIVGSRRFEQLVAGSRAFATAVDTRLRAALEWLSSRDWTEGLRRLPQTMRDVARSLGGLSELFARRTEVGWEIGPLLQGILAGVRWLKAQILNVVDALWGQIGQGFSVLLSDVMFRVRDALAEIGRKIYEASWGAPGHTAAARAMQGLSGAFADAGTALRKASMTAAGSAGRIRDRAREAREDLVALKRALDETVGIAGRRVGGAGRAAAAGVPALPAGAAGEAERQRMRAGFRGQVTRLPEFERLQALVQQRADLAKMLRRDYPEKAKAVAEAAVSMNIELHRMLSNMVGQMERQEAAMEDIQKTLRGFDMRLKRLATAKT